MYEDSPLCKFLYLSLKGEGMCFSNSVVLYFHSPFCLQAVSLQGLFKIKGGITKPAKISSGALSTLDTSYAL